MYELICRLALRSRASRSGGLRKAELLSLFVTTSAASFFLSEFYFHLQTLYKNKLQLGDQIRLN